MRYRPERQPIERLPNVVAEGGDKAPQNNTVNLSAMSETLTKRDPLYWLGLGAISHIVVDLLNVSGVRLLPYNQPAAILYAAVNMAERAFEKTDCNSLFEIPLVSEPR